MYLTGPCIRACCVVCMSFSLGFIKPGPVGSTLSVGQICKKLIQNWNKSGPSIHQKPFLDLGQGMHWSWKGTIFFPMQWHQVAFILLFTSQTTVLNNYLCELDTTLSILSGTSMRAISQSNYIYYLMSPPFWQYPRKVEINVNDNRHFAFVYLLG